MKITKVKLNNKTVIMQRDDSEGYLLHAQEIKKQNQIADLIAQKKTNFELSIISKTLVKETVFNNKKEDDKETREHNKNKKNNLRKLKQLLEHTLNPNKVSAPDKLYFLKKLTKTELKEYLAHKFEEDKPLAYDQKKKSINLLDDLYTTLQQNKTQVSSYKDWANWFIANKQQFLAKSIINNNIKSPNSQTKSKRKHVLDKLADQLVNENGFNLDNLYHELAPVIKQWQICLDLAEKYTQADIDNPDIKDKYKIVDYPKDFFEFKRTLKKALKDQQTKLYKAGKFENVLLEQYSLELTKYLEHYFPLKKSTRRLTLNDIRHYLAEKTVQQTIRQQLENATKQHLLHQGKLISYGLDQQPEITSQDLQRIKIKEAFALQFINATAFAASNLRNVIDPDVKNDILIESDFKKTLHNVLLDADQKTKSIHRLTQFLFNQAISFDTQRIETNHQELIKQLKEADQYLNVVNTIRSAIYAIRNNVVHFDNNALAHLFSTEKFIEINYSPEDQTQTLKDGDEVSFTQQKLLVNLFEEELNSLNQLFAEKIRTSGIIDYYTVEQITTHLNRFTLNAKPLPFMPGFKKVFNWGVTYQTEQKDYLGLTHYFARRYELAAKDNIINKEDQARYNLLGLLYEHQFIHTFLDDRQAFKQAVDNILDANKKRAEEKPEKYKNKQGFKEIARYNTNQSPQDYLKALQSELINDENKKRDEGKLEADQTGHYQQFIWQLFVKGFNNYLSNKSELAFIQTPTYQFDQTINQQTINQQHSRVEQLKNQIAVVNNIKIDNNSHIAFWLFCKMLNSNYLNQLHNQFSKWQQAQTTISTEHNAEIEAFQQIISLNLLTSDMTSADYQNTYKNKDAYFEELLPFTSIKKDKLTNKIDLFVQSDGETPIIHGAIEQTKKYATHNVLIKLLEQNSTFKISAKDIDDWERILKEDHPHNPAKLSNLRQQLHKDWVDAKHKTDYKKNKTDKDKIPGWLNSKCEKSPAQTNGQYYQALCNQLDQYNWLENKLHFVPIRRLHNLLIDILARLAGFTNLLERDFKFLDEGASPYRKDDHYRLMKWTKLHGLIEKKGQEQLKDVFNKTANTRVFEIIDEYSQAQQDKLYEKLQTKRDFYKDYFFTKKLNAVVVRNYIAHFNYLGKIDDKKSILVLLSEVRNLMSYDRKLKNAVAKSFIDLLDKHGIIIKFEPLHDNQHSFKIADIKSKQITHLGGTKIKLAKGEDQPITTVQHHEQYIKMVRALLELKA